MCDADHIQQKPVPTTTTTMAELCECQNEMFSMKNSHSLTRTQSELLTPNNWHLNTNRNDFAIVLWASIIYLKCQTWRWNQSHYSLFRIIDYNLCCDLSFAHHTCFARFNSVTFQTSGLIEQHLDLKPLSFTKWVNPGLWLIYFFLFTSQFKYNLKKCRYFAWDSNPGPQNGRPRWTHWGLAAASKPLLVPVYERRRPASMLFGVLVHGHWWPQQKPLGFEWGISQYFTALGNC